MIPNTWTPAKNASNLIKHDVAFEAAGAFDWANALVTADVRFAYPEPRMAALGMIGDRLHALVFTVERRTTHIISLRKANQKEFDRYAAS